MALTAQQICVLARGIARVPGFTVANGANPSSGDLLNYALQDLAQNYDIPQAEIDVTVSLTTAIGTGPYPLPSNYLRAASSRLRFAIAGVKYNVTYVDYEELNALSQESALVGTPRYFSIVFAASPPTMFVFPAPSVNTSVNIRYYRQMPDIANPETSGSIPWFQNTAYLVTRTAGEIMRLASDMRADAYLGDSPSGAQGILNRYLNLSQDNLARTITPPKDARQISISVNNVPQQP